MYQNCNLTSGVGTFSAYPTYPTVLPPYQAPQQVPTGLPGRVVSKLDDIQLSDVPMNGASSLFPLQDNSAIYVKSWNADGTIRTFKYVLEKPQENIQNEGTDPLKELKSYIDDRFDRLEREVLPRG